MTLRSLLPFLLAILPLRAAWAQDAGVPAAKLPPPPDSVVVAAADLPAGTRLAPPQLAKRALESGQSVRSFVAADQATMVVGKRLLEPVSAGEPLRWTQFPNWYGLWAIDDYCARLKAGGARRRTPPLREGGVPESVRALVAARPLREGMKLEEAALAVKDLPGDLVGPLGILEDERPLAVGDELLVTVLTGEPLRFTQLASYAGEPRCQWLEEDAGNKLAQRPPSDAKTVKCPAGTVRFEGLPGGTRWTPAEAGYTVVCKTASPARRHGPYVAWDRVSGKRHIVGAYRAGKRHGTWVRLDDHGKPLGEHPYDEGLPTGTWIDRDEKGGVVRREELAKGTRVGVYRWDPLEGQFKDGVPSGTWKTKDAEGNPLEVRFDALEQQAGDQAAFVVAKRALAAGEPLAEDAVEVRQLPAVLDEVGFIQETGRKFAVGSILRVNVPAGTPLLWDDFVTDKEDPDPAGLPKRVSAK